MLKFNDIHINHVNLILFLCLLPLAFIGFGSFYIFQLDNLLRNDLKSSILNIGVDASNIAQLRMNSSIIRLESIAANPILTGASSEEDKIKFLQETAKQNGWEDIIIANEKGLTTSINGKSMNVSRRAYFNEAINGNPAYSGILNSPLYPNPVVAHAVPLIKDHVVVGVLIAVQDATEIHFALGSRINEQADATIQFMDSNGVLLKGTEIMHDNFYAKVAGENRLDYEYVRSLIASQGDLNRTFLYNGQESYLTINAIGFSGWSVITIIPRQRAAKLIGDVRYFSIGMMLLMLALLGAYIIYLLKIRKTYKYQANIAQTVLHVDGIFYTVIDSSAKILYANDTLRKYIDLNLKIPTYLCNFLDNIKVDALNKLLKEGKPFVLPIITNTKQKIYIQWNILPSAEKGTWTLLGSDFSAHHHKVEMELTKSHSDDLQQIIDSLPSPVLVYSIDGVVLVANASARRVLETDNLDHFPAAIKRSIGENAFNERLSILKNIAEHGETITNTVQFTNSKGKKTFLQSIYNPLFDKDGMVKSCVSLSVDITETIDIQNRLKTDLSRLQAILDNCPAGVFFSTNGIIHYCNPKAQEMAGVYMGGPAPNGDTMVAGDVAALQQCIIDGTNAYDRPFTTRNANGELQDLLITAICATWNRERVNVVWALDVTEMRKIQEELTEARDIAESATKAKGDFLATMSHEIRTPMNAILGFLHLFDRENLSFKQTNYLEKITISAAGLLRIINDILDFSKIEANKMDLELAPFNLTTNMDAIYSIMFFTAKDKGLELISTIDPNVPKLIVGDRERLNQILLNLLGNAIKFTQQGKVSLQVKVQEILDEENIILEFIVKDTGIGLSEEQSARLFQPFTQADTSTSRRFGGTGLGLVISSRLVELMGGRIKLKSKLEQGSTFSFAIKVQIARAEQLESVNATDLDELFASESYAQVDLACLEGKNVLIAEDNMINQEIVSALLEGYALNIDFANNGQDAFDKVTARQYDLVFMDLQMPIMDGLESTRKIRELGDKLPYLKTLPIIAMTANVLSEDKIRCHEAGMNGHVAKPISPPELRNTLIHWLCNNQLK